MTTQPPVDLASISHKLTTAFDLVVTRLVPIQRGEEALALKADTTDGPLFVKVYEQPRALHA